MTTYGCARVSTDGQSVDAQVKQLRQAGAANVFRETASGARADRPQLRRALAKLDAGDVCYQTRINHILRAAMESQGLRRTPANSKKPRSSSKPARS